MKYKEPYLRIIKGDTFSYVAHYKCDNQPVDLTDDIITATVHSLDNRFNINIPCTVTSPTSGGFILGKVDTSNWIIGNLILVITRKHKDILSSVKTSLIVEFK